MVLQPFHFDREPPRLRRFGTGSFLDGAATPPNLGGELLSWLRYNIDQCHLALRDGVSRAPQRRAQVFRIRDWSLSIDAHAACDHRVIDIRIFNRRTDPCVGYTALMTIGHALDVHDLLVIGTIVVHDAEQRNPMMCRRPKRARRIHEITVILYADAKTPILPVRERGANRCRQTRADPRCAAGQQSLILLLDIPQPAPATSDARPIFILYDCPYFGR